jgi:hypothetical protein
MNCLINELYALGIILIHTGSGVLSTAMDEPEIEQFVSAMYAALCTLRPALEELQ